MPRSPPAPPARAEPLVELLHGTPVADPYRWLEDGDLPETRAWVEAQNARTRAVLDALPGRAAIRDWLDQLLSVGSVSAPAVRGSRFFYTRRDGRQNQPVLLLRDGLDGPDRPLLDLLRYQTFRIARLWIAEYGSAEEAEAFQWLHAYSPYHRVRDGERYPAVFLLTADGDSRVDPMHARKMVARLQAASASAAPVLLRVESAAGHGVGKPRAKILDELHAILESGAGQP